MFETPDGRIGMGQIETKEGDIIAVPYGGKVPYVLLQNGENFRFVSTCFIFDVILGKAVTDGQPHQDRTFSIV